MLINLSCLVPKNLEVKCLPLSRCVYCALLLLLSLCQFSYVYGCNGGGCAEFFTKYLKSEVSKQVRRQSLQPGDTKTSSSQVTGDTKTSSSQVPVDTKTLSQVTGDTKTSSSHVSGDIQRSSSQVCECQSLQPGDMKTSSSQVLGDPQRSSSQVCQCQSLQPGVTKTSLSLVTSTDNSVAHTALVSIFPPATHDLSLPSPSDLLAQLKVTLTVYIQASVL